MNRYCIHQDTEGGLLFMTIDDVLLPYANSQPEHIHIYNQEIERIPMIVNPDTGQVTDQFQQFYDKIVHALTIDKQWEQLYELTDTSLSADEFNSMLKGVGIADTWDRFWNTSDSSRGVDIELNLGRFQSQYRNLIGGFLVMIYMIASNDNDLCNYPVLELKRYTTEILFTYSNGQFKVLSTIKPFTQLSSDEL